MTENVIAGVPRVPAGMVARSGLLQRVGRSPLTVIRAPGGSGKTVLMAQWAQAHARAGAWVTVEPDLGDRAAFWSAVADALGVPLAEHDRGSLVQLFRRRTEPAVLVIDDAHELRDAAVFDDLLAVLRAAPQVTAVVGTRARSELEAPAQALTLDIEVLTPEDLLLTPEDIDALVGESGSEFGTTAELLEASGGNPLLLRAILTGSSAGVRAGSSSQAVVRDHLRRLFSRAGDEFVTFASATSVPDDFDLPTAARLCGVDAQRLADYVEQLELDGLVMRRDEASEPRYRYHPLVREVLRENFRHEHPEQYRRASLLASTEAERRRLYVPALRHAVDAEDYMRASDVVLHGGFALLRSRGAASVLQRVPLRYVTRLPFVAVVLGLAANARGERLRALQLLTVALAASRATRSRQRVAERVGLALVESSILRITGRAADSVGAARRVLALLDEAAPADLEELAEQEGAYRYQAALSLFRAGRLEEAATAAERVGISEEALAAGRPESLGAASLVAVVRSARGESAAALLERIDAAPYAAEQHDGYLGSLAHLARAIRDLECNDPDSAARHAELFRDRENLEYGTLFTAMRALAALWRGSAELGLKIVDDREAIDRPRARLSAEDRRVVAALRVLVHAADGRLGPAHSVLRTLERSDPLSITLHAALLLQEQNARLVIDRLSAHRSDDGPRLRAAADLLTASASLLRDDRPLAESSLRRFLAASALHGITTPVLLIPAELREALWDLAADLGTPADALAALRAVPAPFRVTPLRISLTPREYEVLAQLRDTASLSDIADSLSVSPNTVKTQVRTLYRKLEVGNRDEALRVGHLHGLFRD